MTIPDTRNSEESRTRLEGGARPPVPVIAPGHSFATVTDNLRFYHASLDYTATDLVVELDPVGADFLAHAQTANQTAIGTLLYDSLLTANGDLLTVMMDSFPGLDGDGVRAGMDSLSGPIHAWAPVAVSEIGVQIGRAAADSPRAAASAATRRSISGLSSKVTFMWLLLTS